MNLKQKTVNISTAIDEALQSNRKIGIQPIKNLVEAYEMASSSISSEVYDVVVDGLDTIDMILGYTKNLLAKHLDGLTPEALDLLTRHIRLRYPQIVPADHEMAVIVTKTYLDRAMGYDLSDEDQQWLLYVLFCRDTAELRKLRANAIKVAVDWLIEHLPEDEGDGGEVEYNHCLNHLYLLFRLTIRCTANDGEAIQYIKENEDKLIANISPYWIRSHIRISNALNLISLGLDRLARHVLNEAVIARDHRELLAKESYTGIALKPEDLPEIHMSDDDRIVILDYLENSKLVEKAAFKGSVVFPGGENIARILREKKYSGEVLEILFEGLSWVELLKLASCDEYQNIRSIMDKSLVDRFSRENQDILFYIECLKYSRAHNLELDQCGIKDASFEQLSERFYLSGGLPDATDIQICCDIFGEDHLLRALESYMERYHGIEDIVRKLPRATINKSHKLRKAQLSNDITL